MKRHKALTDNMRAIGEHMSAMPGMDDMKDGGPFFDNELRAIYAAEMHDWKALGGADAGAGIQDPRIRSLAIGGRELRPVICGMRSWRRPL